MADPAVVALRKKKLWYAPELPRMTRSNAGENKRKHDEMETASDEETKRSYPDWTKPLKNINEVETGWLAGTAKSLEEANQVIDAHSRFILCDYIKSHPSSVNKKHRNFEQSRLLWHAKHIPFDGTPLTVKAYHQFRCAFSMKYKSKRKDDNDVINNALKNITKTPYKGITCTDCPAKIIIKEIKKYPKFSIPLNASKQKKMNALKSLKQDLKDKTDVEDEERIIVAFPLPQVHNHAFCGKNRSIHQSILKRIKGFIDKGHTAPKKIKSLLADSVKEEFKDNPIPPQQVDQAFYPSLKNIHNIVYNYTKKSGSHNHNGTVTKVKRKESVKKEAKVEEEFIGPVSPEPTTLEEAVEAFCSESFSEVVDYSSEGKCGSNDLARKVRDKLDELHTLTYSISDTGKLQVLLDNVQLFIDQFTSKHDGEVVYGFQENPLALSPESTYPVSVLMTSYPLSQNNSDSSVTQYESSQDFVVSKSEKELFIEQTTLNHDQL